MEDSFKERNISLATVPPDADLRDVAGKLLESERNVVLVGREGEDIQGYIDCKTIIKWLLMGDERAKVKAGDIAVLIKDENRIELSTDMEEVVERISKYREIPLFASESGNIAGGIFLPQILAELASSRSAEKQKRTDLEYFIEMIIDVLPFGIAVVSVEGEINKSNELARKIILENRIGDKELRSIIKGDYRSVFKSKTETYYKVETSSIRGTNYVLIVFIDISAEYMLMERLKEAQNEVVDVLTNAYNRRYFTQKLEEEIERAKRADGKFSLIMLDIDRFKSINDRFGHNAGDLVLKSIAELIKNRIRKIDTLARWGGEEFVILLPDTTAKNAARLAEELRESLSRMDILGVGSVTASFGVAGYSPGDTVDILLQRADNHMYEAKAAGRDRVRYNDECG